MNNITRTKPIGMSLFALLFSALACNMPGPRIGGPEKPTQAPTPSAESLESFNDKWRDLNLATPDGPFSMTFTEAELSSALADALQEAKVDGGQDIPIENPSVVLKDGTINLYGQVSINTFQANGLIVAVPSIGQDGLIHIQISSVEFGPIDLDPSLLDTLVSNIEQSINAPIQSSPFNIVLTSITIADGEMTIDGTITP
jgi:hypothetical protein